MVKLKNILLFNLLLLFSLLACSKSTVPTPPPPPPNPCLVNGVDTCVANAGVLTATINLSGEKQIMHSFGASDCWGIKFVGKNWPVAKRNEIADLLFSKEVDANGNPKGIGLSMWRINVGAGSYEQGTASNISSEWRREECFQNANGTYDWTKQAGNRWFAQAAKSRGVENLLLFSIAAPVHMSKNGLATGDPAAAELGKLNLQPGKYVDYADFLAEVAKNYTQAGMPINYISPVNETNWNWVLDANGQASQEGTSATNAEIFQLTSALNAKIISKGLTAKIAVCESGGHGYTTGPIGGNTGRSDFINYFWNPASTGYVGNLPSVEKIISSHSYGAQANITSLVNNRTNLANRIAGVNTSVKYWQSEYCVLGSEDGITGPTRDLGINAALYIARVIHTDIAIGNAASWQWWLGVTPSDYKDGLVYIADPAGTMGELPATKTDGQIYKSKMLWALGSFSRFVRPGMIRVDASMQNNTDPAVAANGLMISAYKNPTIKEIVTVVINMSTKDEKIKLSGFTFGNSVLKTYITSAIDEMKYAPVTATDKLTVGARSIVTFVSTYQ